MRDLCMYVRKICFWRVERNRIFRNWQHCTAFSFILKEKNSELFLIKLFLQMLNFNRSFYSNDIL